MLTTILLAVSISIDALGIGASYGTRGISINALTKIVLTLESIFLLSIFVFFGNSLTVLFSKTFANNFGIILLLSMGAWLCFQDHFKKKPCLDRNITTDCAMELIRNPSACDFNHSSTLEAKEAVALGFILSIDALGTGIGAASAGISMPFLPLFAALLQTLLLTIGQCFGQRLKRLSLVKESLWTKVSGIILFFIAFIRIIFG